MTANRRRSPPTIRGWPRRWRRLHADLQRNGPGHAAEIERGAGAVREALFLAQIEVDAADELAAEHHVRRDERVVVGRVSRDRHMADAQLGLRRTRPRNRRSAAAAAAAATSAGIGRGGSGPVVERRRGERLDVLVHAVAGHHQRRIDGRSIA